MTIDSFKSLDQLERVTSLGNDDIFLLSRRDRGTVSSYSIDFTNLNHSISSTISGELIQPLQTNYSALYGVVENLSNSVSAFEKIIPQNANENNKLADKNFVNSSIASNTSFFRGTYSSYDALQQVTAYNNDYAFVVSSDATTSEVSTYNRYKYLSNEIISQGWTYEYTLNNSSFTAGQWSTINSGITKDLVDSLCNLTSETWTFYMKDSTPQFTRKIAYFK